MITILFDIDGTLIQTGGAGFQAIRLAWQDLFDAAIPVPDVPVHGRTDQGILTDVFRAQSQDYSQWQETFNQFYWNRLPDTLRESPGRILPGVVPLLEALAARPDIALGLLTGNGQVAARIKLRHFGLDTYFPFGGFGDHHADRNDVAMLARHAAAEHLGGDFREDRLWVVGDTVDDVRCGRAIGARVLAVETGGTDAQTLRQASPDVQFDSLVRQEDFFRHVCVPAAPGGFGA